MIYFWDDFYYRPRGYKSDLTVILLLSLYYARACFDNHSFRLEEYKQSEAVRTQLDSFKPKLEVIWLYEVVSISG